MKLTKAFIRSAIDDNVWWDLGNDVLYKLCSDHPNHKQDDVIMAKIWLIGRAYAAAIERRRNKGDNLGDTFYEKCVIPAFRKSDIDDWLGELRKDMTNNPVIALRVHKKLTDLFAKITGEKKRSLASKYLHFHFPKRFFIYDSRSDKSSRKIMRTLGLKTPSLSCDNADDEYAGFFSRCIYLADYIQGITRQPINSRDLDKVLLMWSREYP